MKKVLALLLAAFVLAACEKEKSSDKDIRVTAGATNQTVYADETASAENPQVKFSTTGPWHTEVEDATESKAAAAADWVTLSRTSGDAAGDYTLEITLSVNYTGADRKALIRIVCGETVVTITIVQKGVTEAGEQPVPDPNVPGTGKAAKEIITYGSVPAGTIDTHSWFECDDQGRIVQTSYMEDGDSEPFVEQKLVYEANRLILTAYDEMVEVKPDGSSESHVVELVSHYEMEDGRLVKGLESDGEPNRDTWTYDEGGYLVEYKSHGSWEEGICDPEGNCTTVTKDYFTTYAYTWENGCPVTVTQKSDNEKDPLDLTARCEFGNRAFGIANFDLFTALIETGDWGMGYNLAGKRPARLPEKIVMTDNSDGEVQEATFRYEFDGDGAVTKVYRNLNNHGEELIVEIVY